MGWFSWKKDPLSEEIKRLEKLSRDLGKQAQDTEKNLNDPNSRRPLARIRPDKETTRASRTRDGMKSQLKMHRRLARNRFIAATVVAVFLAYLLYLAAT